jgi:hypothetical protein
MGSEEPGPQGLQELARRELGSGGVRPWGWVRAVSSGREPRPLAQETRAEQGRPPGQPRRLKVQGLVA